MKAVSYKRILAYIIDIFLVTIVASLLTMFIPVSKEYQEKANELNEVLEDYTEGEITEDEYLEKVNDISYVVNKESVATSIVTVVITIVYFVVVAYYMNGQTIGKKLMHLQVVSTREKKLNMNQLLIRSLLADSILMNIISIVTIILLNKTMYLKTYDITTTIFGAVFVAIFAMILFREDGRGLHDILAKTKVISINNNLVLDEVIDATIVEKEETKEIKENKEENKKKVKKVVKKSKK